MLYRLNPSAPCCRFPYSNEVDLLIYPYKDSEVPKSVRFFKLFEDHFVYITRKGHPLEKVPSEEIHLHKNPRGNPRLNDMDHP